MRQIALLLALVMTSLSACTTWWEDFADHRTCLPGAPHSIIEVEDIRERCSSPDSHTVTCQKKEADGWYGYEEYSRHWYELTIGARILASSSGRQWNISSKEVGESIWPISIGTHSRALSQAKVGDKMLVCFSVSGNRYYYVGAPAVSTLDQVKNAFAPKPALEPPTDKQMEALGRELGREDQYCDHLPCVFVEDGVEKVQVEVSSEPPGAVFSINENATCVTPCLATFAGPGPFEVMWWNLIGYEMLTQRVTAAELKGEKVKLNPMLPKKEEPGVSGP